MSEKSHVGTGFYLCPVCGNKHSETVLLDRRMHKTLTQNMFMGQELCAEDKQKFSEGYIAMVEIDNTIEPNSNVKTMKQEDAQRTGRIFHIRKHAVSELFDVTEAELDVPLIFIDVDVGNKLFGLLTQAKEVQEAQSDSSSQNLH